MRLAIRIFICVALSMLSMYFEMRNDMFRTLSNGYCVKTKEVIEDPRIRHMTYYKRDVHFLGISFNKQHYMQNETLAIYDESQVCPKVLIGREPYNDHEIVLSENSAVKFTKNIHTLLGRQVMLYYSQGRQVKGVSVNIVGIAPKDKKDLVYFYSGASLSYMKRLYKIKTPDYAIFHLKDNRDLGSLKKKYPKLTFHKINAKRQKKGEALIILVMVILGALLVKLNQRHQNLMRAFVVDSGFYLLSVCMACVVGYGLRGLLIITPNMKACTKLFALWYLVVISPDFIRIIRNKHGNFDMS